MAKQAEVIEQTELCEGIYLSEHFYDQKENRLLTLILKGFIVYLLTMGSIGFYLSALKIEYNVMLVHIVVFVVAMLSAMLYYRLLIENLGYLLLLGFFGGLVLLFKVYINSGFYAVVNITVDAAAQYFDIDIQRLYNEAIGNRYVTVTCVAMFIGVVMDVLLNVYISRRMKYTTAMFIVMFFNVIPLYMTEEPDLLYASMLLVGISIAYVLKVSRHYSPQVSTKRSNHVFSLPKKKKKTAKKNKELSYVYDVKALSQASCFVLVIVLLITMAASTIKPKENFNSGYKMNKYKELTMAGMSTLLMDGISGFFHKSRDVGGMDGGKLGDVSSIHLDYQTDLVMEVTPYTYDMIYLKAFTGASYVPYENFWVNIESLRDYDKMKAPAEANAYKDAFESGNPYVGQGKMKVRNIAADVRADYVPYYAYSSETAKNGTEIYTYYPPFEEANVPVTVDYYSEYGPYGEMDLEVPEENKEVIKEFVEELELESYNPADVEETLKEYFQENYPYTVKPGKTPKKQDFVNYFLAEGKKGYCSYYASAATLVFRYLGIPARYVEGYAVDFYQITDGELVIDEQYGDYYQGYNALGETALIQVDITDADAHAWVEIYEPRVGWRVVDVTPTGGDQEEAEDFWTEFDRFVGGDDSDDDGGIFGGGGGIKISDDMVKKVLLGVFTVIAVVIGGYVLLKLLMYLIFIIRLLRTNYSDRLVMQLGLVRKRLRRYNKEFGKCLNYREQVEYYATEEETSNRVIDILERAGFSNREISKDEYTFAREWMKKNMKLRFKRAKES